MRVAERGTGGKRRQMRQGKWNGIRSMRTDKAVASAKSDERKCAKEYTRNNRITEKKDTATAIHRLLLVVFLFSVAW